MNEAGLRRRVALVTGANHGIGAATARALAAAGCEVFIQFLRYSPSEEAGAEQRAQDAAKIVREISETGGRASSWETDLAVPASVPALFDRVEKDLGPVEILVNNAAVTERDSLDPGQDSRDWAGRPKPGITAETIDRNFAVNTRAVALMMAEYARRHVARGAKWGRIINVSTDGSASFPGEVSYGASKYAVESYSRAAAGEMGRFGITVNIVSPGPTDTGWITPAMVPDMERMAPLGRVGKPEDIADVIAFLASENARWLTGQLLFAGGGHRMF